MDRKIINSSIIGAVGYDPSSLTLEVEQNDGTIYQFYKVGPETYRQLMASESKEMFYDEEVKTAFQFAVV